MICSKALKPQESDHVDCSVTTKPTSEAGMDTTLFSIRSSSVSESFDSDSNHDSQRLSRINSNQLTTQNGFLQFDSNRLLTQMNFRNFDLNQLMTHKAFDDFDSNHFMTQKSFLVS